MKKINDLLQRKNIRNGMWLYFLQFFNTVVPLLTLPYITRILGPSQYGVFAIALNLIGYLQVVVEYGFNMSATRKIALANGKNKIDKIFFSVNYSRMILLFFSMILVIMYIFFTDLTKVQNFTLLILTINLVGVSLQQNWLFQGLQEMKYVSIISVISRSLSVVSIFIFVNTSDDLFMYCLLYAISPLVNGLLGTIYAIRKYSISFVKINVSVIIRELKDGWYVFTTSLSSRLFNAIGITFLGLFSTIESVGVFSAIQKVPNVIFLAWLPISQVLYPIVSKKMNISYKDGVSFVYSMRRKILVFFIAFAIIIGVCSKPIVSLLFGPSYVEFSYWILPLLLWLIVSINNNFLGVQILLASGHDKEYSQCFQLGVISTIVINFIFIALFKGDGAAISPLLSEVVLMVALTSKINKLNLDQLTDEL